VRFITRGCQECAEFPRSFLYGRTYDVAARIDAEAVEKIQGGARRNDVVEVDHCAVLPEEDAAVAAHIAGLTNHLAFVIDRTTKARDVPWKRAEAAGHVVLPQESHTNWAVECRTDDLPLVIDGAWRKSQVSECTQVGRCSFLPKYGVGSRQGAIG
jgi:hypothetical protein